MLNKFLHYTMYFLAESELKNDSRPIPELYRVFVLYGMEASIEDVLKNNKVEQLINLRNKTEYIQSEFTFSEQVEFGRKYSGQVKTRYLSEFASQWIKNKKPVMLIEDKHVIAYGYYDLIEQPT